MLTPTTKPLNTLPSSLISLPLILLLTLSALILILLLLHSVETPSSASRSEDDTAARDLENGNGRPGRFVVESRVVHIKAREQGTGYGTLVAAKEGGREEERGEVEEEGEGGIERVLWDNRAWDWGGGIENRWRYGDGVGRKWVTGEER